MSEPESRAKTQRQLQDLFDSFGDISVVLADLDPYSGSFGAELAAAANAHAAKVWPGVARILVHAGPELALRNAWAVAAANPKWLVLLHRSVLASRSSSLKSLAGTLLDRTRNVLRASPSDEVIALARKDANSIPPDLGSWTHLKPGLRLRYALAHRWARGASARQLIEIARNQPNASEFVRRRELARALDRSNGSRPRVAPLGRAEFLTLPERVRGLFIDTAEYFEVPLAAPLAREADLGGLAARWGARLRDRTAQLASIKSLLRNRRFVETEPLLDSLPLDAVSRRLAAGLFALERGRSVAAEWKPWWLPPTTPRPPKAWVALSDRGARQLRALSGTNSFPEHWSWTAHEIAGRLADGRLSRADITALDLALLWVTWSQPDLQRLADAGRYDLLPAEAIHWEALPLEQLILRALENPESRKLIAKRLRSLPDARPLLALLARPQGKALRAAAVNALKPASGAESLGTWSGYIAGSTGTPEWRAAARVALRGTNPLGDAVAFLQAGGHPAAPEQFRQALVELAAAGLVRDSTAMAAVAKILALDPATAHALAQLLPLRRLEAIVSDAATPDPVVEAFWNHAPPEATRTLWEAKLRRARSAAELRSLLSHPISVAGRIPWDPEWEQVKGKASERNEALVLASRRDWKRLRRVADVLGDASFLRALRRSLAVLPAGSLREKGFLELVECLGPSEIPYLAAVLTMADRDAGPGRKLDGAYHRYPLPKQSGGSRLISAPHRHLKRVQRAVLDRLLTPLGAHEAAFGFVKGRSIARNAAVHVGMPIVANADIRNCFGSVGWSLVLGSLRRDLGGRFSPGTISLLVDICTVEGVLPTGAPTSPALLNRILLKTDEVLFAAATKKRCRYSRYADDLTFSGDHGAVELLGVAKRTLSQIRLGLDPKKTTIYRPGRRQIVTGLVVNVQVNVPRRLRRRMRAAVHAVERGRAPRWHGNEETVSSLHGRLAFLNSVTPGHAAPLLQRLGATRSREPVET